MANNCADCVYHCKVTGIGAICDYINKAGQMRPCPPGDACTVKVRYKRRQYPKRRKKVEE